MDSLFDDAPERDAFLRRVEALVAPVAAHAGVVIDDPNGLEVARAVFDAFGSPEAFGGLTRAQIHAACTGVCDEAEFDSRFDLFCRLDMLEPVYEKAHQQRYVFNPTSAAGIMVFDRLARNGGVDELVTLLDRTRSEMVEGRATRADVQAQIKVALMMMSISADHLRRMVDSSPLAELIAQRRHHNHGSLMENVFALDKEVRERFEDLDIVATELVRQTQRYITERDRFVERLLAEGAASKDFSMLDPEDYLAAARTADVAMLAEVFATVVFDPPSPHLDPSVVAAKITDFVPRPTLRRRPPRPPGPDDAVDPMSAVEARVADSARKRERAMSLFLQGEDEADLTTRMRAAGWPGAAQMFVQALGIHGDPRLSAEMVLSDELLVDPDGAVTRVTPVSLRQVSPTDQVVAAAVAALDADLEDLEDQADLDETRTEMTADAAVRGASGEGDAS